MATKQDQNEDWRFAGVTSPNTTQVPDQYLDELLPVLSGAELKVLLYITRRTFGFKKDSDNISLSQMLRGITTKDGRILDRGVGLSKKTLLLAINNLEEKEVIFTHRRQSQEKGNEATTYSLNIIASPLGIKSTPPLGEKLHQGVGVESTPSPRGKNYTKQHTVIQQTVEQQTDRYISKNTENGNHSFVQDTPRSNHIGELTAVGDIIPPSATNTARLRRPRTEEPQEKQVIRAYIRDFSREFADQAKLSSSTTRAYNLFVESGLPLEEFISRLYQARSITKERTASIEKRTGETDGLNFQTKNKTPYWFAVLEDLLGMREHSSDNEGVKKEPASKKATRGPREAQKLVRRRKANLSYPQGP